jgi:hypothetical protein
MTRKDYRLIAKVLKENCGPGDVAVVLAFTNALEETYKNFNRTTFLEAALNVEGIISIGKKRQEKLG